MINSPLWGSPDKMSNKDPLSKVPPTCGAVSSNPLQDINELETMPLSFLGKMYVWSTLNPIRPYIKFQLSISEEVIFDTAVKSEKSVLAKGVYPKAVVTSDFEMPVKYPLSFNSSSVT